MIIEICANSFESAQAAQLAEADRIELCTELSVGGLTPSHGLIEKVVSELNIPTIKLSILKNKVPMSGSLLGALLGLILE